MLCDSFPHGFADDILRDAFSDQVALRPFIAPKPVLEAGFGEVIRQGPV